MGVMNEDRLTLYDGLIKTHITNTTVAKETGKGLSTNDYTTTEKNKLAGIAEGANKTIVDSALNASSENPVQNKVIYTEFEKKLDKDGDSKDLTNTFVSQDSTNVTQWTDVDVLTSAEKHSSVFNKISTMFKNIRYLYKMLGTADISALGEGADIGTVTGALSKLNSDKQNKIKTFSFNGVTDSSGNLQIELNPRNYLLLNVILEQPSTSKLYTWVFARYGDRWHIQTNQPNTQISGVAHYI